MHPLLTTFKTSDSVWGGISTNTGALAGDPEIGAFDSAL